MMILYVCKDHKVVLSRILIWIFEYTFLSLGHFDMSHEEKAQVLINNMNDLALGHLNRAEPSLILSAAPALLKSKISAVKIKRLLNE